jgi:Flp pilus assembly protein CpaB
MEATTTSNKIGNKSMGDVLSTRGGTTGVAVAAAVLAGILLFVFVQRYRHNQSAASAPTTVFVARSLIPQGSAADVIASQQLWQRTSVRGSQLQSGAIADPSVLHGEVAAVNIYPGQQITASDFTTSTTVASQLGANERAVSVPVDGAHGLVGFVHTGDHVDVLASYTAGAGANRGSVATLVQDVVVLNAPTATGGLGNTNSNTILLRVPASDAPSLAFAADNGKVWVALRPPLGVAQAAQATPATPQPAAPPTTSATGGH